LHIPFKGNAAKRRASVPGLLGEPELGKRDNDLVQPWISHSGPVSKLFFLIRSIQKCRRPENDDEAQRDVPVRDQKPNNECDGEDCSAAAAAPLFLHLDPDRLAQAGLLSPSGLSGSLTDTDGAVRISANWRPSSRRPDCFSYFRAQLSRFALAALPAKAVHEQEEPAAAAMTSDLLHADPPSSSKVKCEISERATRRRSLIPRMIMACNAARLRFHHKSSTTTLVPFAVAVVRAVAAAFTACETPRS
jgi:hypothetical protein